MVTLGPGGTGLSQPLGYLLSKCLPFNWCYSMCKSGHSWTIREWHHSYHWLALPKSEGFPWHHSSHRRLFYRLCQVSQPAPIWLSKCLQRPGVTALAIYFGKLPCLKKKKKNHLKKRVWHSGNCSITNMLCNHISLKNRCFFLIMKNILLPPYGTANDSPTDLSGSILSWPYVPVPRNGWVIHARHILVYQLKLLEVCMICVSVIKPC